MKATIKKLGAMLIALAMVLSLSPVSGMVLADDTETSIPETTGVTESEKSKETEKPAVKETEASKEPENTEKTDPGKTEESEKPAETTPKETEAPSTEAPEEKESSATEAPKETESTKETEAPAATEPEVTKQPDQTTPEETQVPDESKAKSPDDNVSQAPKKGVITVGTINAKITDGVLTWDTYPNAVYYTFRISEGRSSMDYSNSEREIDLKEWIDGDIEWGFIENLGSYTIRLTAYDNEDYLIGEWSTTFTYSSDATLQEQTGKIENIKITNSILTWSSYPDTEEYFVMINGVSKAWYPEPLNFSNHRTIYDLIDEAIREGEIEKKSPYIVRVVAYGEYGDLANGKITVPYDSPAKRLVKCTFDNVKISEDSVLSWDKLSIADCYGVHIDYNDGQNITGDWADDNLVTNSLNLNQAITEMINDGRLTIPDCCNLKIDLYAWDAEGTCIAFESTNFLYSTLTPNPLSVKGKTAKVKYKKLRKKKQKLSVSKVISGIKTGKGSITYYKISGNKKISINKWNGRVTIKKKGLKKKKTYKVTVKIKASGDSTYAPVEKKVTFRIKVK